MSNQKSMVSPHPSEHQTKESQPLITRSGSQLVEALQQEDVDFIFGYPGGAVLPLYDTFYDGKIKHILARHEQGATHAAEGYARVSGKTGVVVVTSGPGATNAITGITDAYSDSLPLVVLLVKLLHLVLVKMLSKKLIYSR